jgi:hypothetical protein
MAKEKGRKLVIFSKIRIYYLWVHFFFDDSKDSLCKKYHPENVPARDLPLRKGTRCCQAEPGNAVRYDGFDIYVSVFLAAKTYLTAHAS